MQGQIPHHHYLGSDTERFLGEKGASLAAAKPQVCSRECTALQGAILQTAGSREAPVTRRNRYFPSILAKRLKEPPPPPDMPAGGRGKVLRKPPPAYSAEIERLSSWL
uniref:Uncharacterized protein n=1 Tax=Micrurus corallinus TaxID=54390 RepID=A0A2D4FUM0_MICCO